MSCGSTVGERRGMKASRRKAGLSLDDVSTSVPAVCRCLGQVSDKGSLTAEEFAKLLGLSVLLSKER